MRNKIIETANHLQEKHNIPAVRENLDLIRDLQTDSYWQRVTLFELEHLRRQLRELTQFIERASQRVIFTDFVDELGTIREADVPYVTGGVHVAQYCKKVEHFLRSHGDHFAIQKVRHARPLTATDLSELERFFFEASEVESREAFEQAYGPQENLGAFIRRLVGLDRRAAKALFSRFLDDKACTAEQIHFVDHLINYLTRNDVMDLKLLYEQPFTEMSDEGLDGIFDDDAANEIVRILYEVNGSVDVLAA